MRDSLFLTLADTFSKKAPEVCPLCDMHTPTFRYLLVSEFHADHDLQELDGFCCVRCAESFLAAMEHRAAAELDQAVPKSKRSWMTYPDRRCN